MLLTSSFWIVVVICTTVASTTVHSYSVNTLNHGHDFKLIFTKLHDMVELVIGKKPLVFEVKRSTSVNNSGRNCRCNQPYYATSRQLSDMQLDGSALRWDKMFIMLEKAQQRQARMLYALQELAPSIRDIGETIKISFQQLSLQIDARFTQIQTITMHQKTPSCLDQAMVDRNNTENSATPGHL
uniref:Uncharacterized protein n=1 Tax=Eptatretus burgeri TaxID=7764 RepID=A0A8C4PWJ8_EPTBU